MTMHLETFQHPYFRLLTLFGRDTEAYPFVYHIPGTLTKDGKPIMGGVDIDRQDSCVSFFFSGSPSLAFPVLVTIPFCAMPQFSGLEPNWKGDNFLRKDQASIIIKHRPVDMVAHDSFPAAMRAIPRQKGW